MLSELLEMNLLTVVVCVVLFFALAIGQSAVEKEVLAADQALLAAIEKGDAAAYQRDAIRSELWGMTVPAELAHSS